MSKFEEFRHDTVGDLC